MTLLVIIHLIAWLLFFSLIITFITASSETNSIIPLLLTPQFLFFAFIYIFLFYINTYYLIPKVYFNKQYILYFFIILVLFVAVYYTKPFDRLFQLQKNTPAGSLTGVSSPSAGAVLFPPPAGTPFPPGRGMRPPPFGEPVAPQKPHTDIISLILFVMIWSISGALQIVKQWRNVEERAARAEADKAKAELSFLKAQINPHFLFNTLNNIYSLAVSKNENTAVSIMKLSKIMHYVTDEVSQNFVALENEIEFIRDYIDLQRLRLNNKVCLDFSVHGNVSRKANSATYYNPFYRKYFQVWY
ncbi:MAG: histidine kinase [Segetibacter sp.]